MTMNMFYKPKNQNDSFRKEFEVINSYGYDYDYYYLNYRDNNLKEFEASRKGFDDILKDILSLMKKNAKKNEIHRKEILCDSYINMFRSKLNSIGYYVSEREPYYNNRKLWLWKHNTDIVYHMLIEINSMNLKAKLMNYQDKVYEDYFRFDEWEKYIDDLRSKIDSFEYTHTKPLYGKIMRTTTSEQSFVYDYRPRPGFKNGNTLSTSLRLKCKKNNK